MSDQWIFDGYTAPYAGDSSGLPTGPLEISVTGISAPTLQEQTQFGPLWSFTGVADVTLNGAHLTSGPTTLWQYQGVYLGRAFDDISISDGHYAFEWTTQTPGDGLPLVSYTNATEWIWQGHGYNVGMESFTFHVEHPTAPTSAPEPGTFGLLALGLIAAAAVARHGRRLPSPTRAAIAAG